MNCEACYKVLDKGERAACNVLKDTGTQIFLCKDCLLEALKIGGWVLIQNNQYLESEGIES